MDSLAQRVARRFLADTPEGAEIRKRIEQIPNWASSEFLRKMHDIAGRYTLSPKQIAVIEKIEKERAVKSQPAPTNADVVLHPKKQWVEQHEIESIIRALRQKAVVRVFDPRSLVSENTTMQGFFIKELANDFYGAAENYAERNADEDDEEKRERNRMGQDAADAAAHEVSRAKLHVKRDGQVTVLTLTPSYQEVLRKHPIR